MRGDPALKRLAPAAAGVALALCGGTAAGGTVPHGVLRVVVRGLAPGTRARVVVTGPHAYRRAIAGSEALRVAPGQYRVAAGTVAAATAVLVPAVAPARAVVTSGRTVTVTVTYASRAQEPPAPAPGGTAPVVTAVVPASGSVGAGPTWVSVAFVDPECDVVGGTWLAQGEAVTDFGAWGRPDLMRAYACSGGAGSLEFARTCTGASQTIDRVLLIDARGNRSVAVGFPFTCA